MQGLAVASLTGLDTHTEKELPIYAQSLAFAPDGRLWMSHTGEGPRRWNPETDRLETWPLEVGGPLAIRPDGTAWQLGPTYTEPDRPDRIPLDPRPNPRFPLQLLDVERQVIVRTLRRSGRGGLSAAGLDPRSQGVARGGGGHRLTREATSPRLGRGHGQVAPSDCLPESTRIPRAARTRPGLCTRRQPARELGRIGPGGSLERVGRPGHDGLHGAGTR